MISAKKIEGEADLGYVGEVTGVDATVLRDALDRGYIPVIATLGCGEDGTVYNINADSAACRIAAELHAENLISMTDVRGLLRNRDDENTLIPEVKVSEVPLLVRQGVIAGGHDPQGGVLRRGGAPRRQARLHYRRRIPHSILIELMTNEGIGTMFLG